MMRDLLQQPLNSPYVAHRKSPIVTAHLIQARDRIAGDSTSQINVRIKITHHQFTYRTINRLAAVKRYVPRSCHRTVSASLFEQIQNVIQLVLRFDADQKRGITVLLENRRSHKRSFQTVRSVQANNSSKRKTSLSGKLAIVRDGLDQTLNLKRRPVSCNQFPLLSGELVLGWLLAGDYRRSRSGTRHTKISLSGGVRLPARSRYLPALVRRGSFDAPSNS